MVPVSSRIAPPAEASPPRPTRGLPLVHLPRSPLRRHGGPEVRTDRGATRIRAAVSSVRRCGVVDGPVWGERSPLRCLDRRASQRNSATECANRGVRAPSVTAERGRVALSRRRPSCGFHNRHAIAQPLCLVHVLARRQQHRPPALSIVPAQSPKSPAAIADRARSSVRRDTITRDHPPAHKLRPAAASARPTRGSAAPAGHAHHQFVRSATGQSRPGVRLIVAAIDAVE